MGRSSASDLRVIAAVNHGFRPDIEGLRAIAVLAVLAYHAGLGPFSGGYGRRTATTATSAPPRLPADPSARH